MLRMVAAVFLLSVATFLHADPPAAKTPREALKPFGDLVGTWKGTGTLVGPNKDFWIEKMAWEWQFKNADAWLKVAFEKSKTFTEGELRYVADKDQFAFTATTLKKEKLTFTGTLQNKVLTLDRDGDKEAQRIVVTLLHDNRFLYRYEVKPEGRGLYSKKWSVGATKEGVAFAAGDGKPECVVSGGAGSISVSYMGKTYYVCCSGCRTEFNADPAKYVKEYEAKKSNKK